MTSPQGNESTSELRQQAEPIEVLRGGLATPDAPVVARPVRRYRARIFQIYLVGATVGFAVLFFFSRRVAYFSFDLVIERWVQRWHSYWLDVTMLGVSELGFVPLGPIVVVFTILIVFLIGLKWEAVMLLGAAAGIGVFSTGIKLLAHRVRPTADLVNVFSVLSDYSFPSGHVLMFTAYFGFLLFLVYTLTPRSWFRTLGLSLLSALITFVGLSRVYLGHHWPSDVIGAYLFGSLWLTLTIYVYRKGKPHFFVHQPLAPSEPTAGN